MAKSKSIAINMDLLKLAVCAALLLITYMPMFRWMVDRWFAAESYYGHGFLIPMVCAYVAWSRREAIRDAAVSSDMKGLIFVAIGLVAHVMSAALRVYFISGFSFVAVLYGLILFFFGKEVMRQLVFPVFFLLAMVPLPLVLVGTLTVKLKLAVAHASTIILNNIGFPSVRDGSIIKMPGSYIIVGAPCSGLRSLIALITLGLIFAFAAKTTLARKGVLLLSSIPIALGTNVIRVTLLAMVNDLYGQEAATGFFHDLMGYAMFGLAFLALLGVNKLMDRTAAVTGGADE